MKKRILIPLSLLFVFIYSFSALSFFSSERMVHLPQMAPGILTQGDEIEQHLLIKGFENYYLDKVTWTSSNENILEILETTNESFRILAKNPGGGRITVDFDFYYYEDEEEEDTATPSNATATSMATSSNATAPPSDEIMSMKHFTFTVGFVVVGVDGDFKYFERDNDISIYRYIGNDEHVIIPEYIKGKPVTEISMYAITGDNIKQITIPETVTQVYGNYNCLYLTKVINNSLSDINLSNFWETLDEGVNNTWYSEEIGGILLDEVLPAGSTMYRQFAINYFLEGASQQEIDSLISRSGNPVRYSPLHDTDLYNLSNYNGTKFNRWEMKLEDSTYQTITAINKNTWGAIDLYAVYEGMSNNNSSDSGGSTTTSTGLQNYAATTNSGELITTGIYQSAGQWKQDGANWIYLDLEQNIVTNKWIHDRGRWFLVDQNGKMVTGWQKADNQWYLFDSGGSMLTGWKYVNYQWYFLNQDGSMATGWILDNGKYYYLDMSGALLTSTTTPDGYHINSDGVWI
ncbi:MAG: hypothetical protein ACRDBO_12920 [Lachnospiraceae bacterium]